MSATLDCKYLFIGCGNKLRQYSIADVKCVKVYLFKEDFGRVIATLDSKYALVSRLDGNLQQICVKSQKIIRDYPRSYGPIDAMALTNDARFLILGTMDGHLAKVSIIGKEEKDFGKGPSPKYANNRIRTI
jgi:hypothetical protein